MKPICYCLYAGLHGWEEGFVAEGYRCVGFDIEDMCALLGQPRPADCELVIRDVRSIHGSELKDAACIVGSSPCQEFSYRAMPWSRAKALGPPVLGMELFNAQFRIQREAIEAAGHYIPMVVENVRGAQKWVGRAQWHYGSYYLWGDVPALMPMTLTPAMKAIGANTAKGIENGCSVNKMRDAFKAVGHANIRDGHSHTRHLTNQAEHDAVKQGGDWLGKNCESSMSRLYGSKSPKRKAASALIAKIPFHLAQHIARALKPR